MNQPEYILTDEFGTLISEVKTALGFTVLNYQYGYVEELNETLKQWEEDPEKFDKKFPLVWLAEPFTVQRGEPGIYGNVDIDLFLINTTEKTWKATERMANNYGPVLFPIYRKTLERIILSPVFNHTTEEKLAHSWAKGYYWDQGQKSVINDAVDCLKISFKKLRVSNNANCTTLSNL